MGFLDQMKQGAQRTAWEAERMMRQNKANSAVSEARRELDTQIYNLGKTVLQTYEAGATPAPEAAPVYEQLKAVQDKLRQLEQEAERVKQEQAPQAPQAAPPPVYAPPPAGAYAPPPPAGPPVYPPPGGPPPPGYAPTAGGAYSAPGSYPPPGAPPSAYPPPVGPGAYAPPGAPPSPYPPPPAPPMPGASPPSPYMPAGPIGGPYTPTGPVAGPYAPTGPSPIAGSTPPGGTAASYGAPAYAAGGSAPDTETVDACPNCKAPRTDPAALFCQECGTRYS